MKPWRVLHHAVAAGRSPADYGVVWAPPQQFIDEQRQMQAMFSMGAGSRCFAAPESACQPAGESAGRCRHGVQMAEYVCQAVTRHFRELPVYEAEWLPGSGLPQVPPSRASCTVGLLGVGVLGTRAAQALQHFEFPVLSWSRTPRPQPACSFDGEAALPDFLRATQVLVCLLPLTPQTRGVLNARDLCDAATGRPCHQRGAAGIW